MTNEAWHNIAPKLCKDIREMEVICDHADWWVVLSINGFGSHLDNESLQIFSDHKILVVKEEGDTSQVSQAYDQKVAKEDKRFTRAMLEGYKFNSKHMINQWELILVINQALNDVSEGDAWEVSLERINIMKPSKCLPFTESVKR